MWGEERRRKTVKAKQEAVRKLEKKKMRIPTAFV